jgi:hypothetical protein
MEPDTRVALARDQQWTGRIVGKAMDGVVHVKFDAGGSGNFRTDELVVLAAKAWPPQTETKGVQA